MGHQLCRAPEYAAKMPTRVLASSSTCSPLIVHLGAWLEMRKDPAVRSEERLLDRPGLLFVQMSLEKQANEGRLFSFGTALVLSHVEDRRTWEVESPINIDNIKGCRKLQRVDQCCHGAVDENDDPVQKATGIASNIKLKKTARRCSGHNGRKHAQLKGAVKWHPKDCSRQLHIPELCVRGLNWTSCMP